MTKYLRFFIFLLVSSLQFLGSSPVSAQNTYTITGKILGSENKFIHLDYFDAVKFVPIDSAIAKPDGSFSFTKKNQKPAFVRIRLSPENWVMLYVNANENLKLEGNYNKFYENYTLTGDKNNQDLREFIRYLQDFAAKTQNINEKLKTYNTKPETELDSMRLVLGLQVETLGEEYIKTIKKFANDHPNTILVCYALYYLKANEEYEYIDKALNALEYSPLQQSPYFQYYNVGFRATQNSLSALAKGKPAPELTLKDTSGNIVPLSATKGKITLIEFWESGCHGCEMKHPKLLKLYKKYRSQGFEIYGVALDDDLQKWKNGIKRDSLQWINVCELTGFKTSFSFTYDVKFTPQNYLLDQDGLVIGRDFKGEDLEYKIASAIRKMNTAK